MIPQEINYSQEAIDRLLWQYRDSTNLKAVIEAICGELELTQEDVFAIVNSFNIDDGTGIFLDLIGKIVLEDRKGRDDPEYRDALRLKVLLNTSQGTPNTLLEALTLATEATEVRIWEYFPVSTFMLTNGTRLPNNLARTLTRASPASSGGVTVVLDPNENTLIPNELPVSTANLVSHTGDQFITDTLDNIIVQEGSSSGGELAERAILSEYVYEQQAPTFNGLVLNFTAQIYGYDYVEDSANYQDDGDVGILAEIAVPSNDVALFDPETQQALESINNWSITMNHIVPNNMWTAV